MISIANIIIILISVKIPSLKCYDSIAYSHYLLIYLIFMYVFQIFIIMYCDKIVIPYHGPSGCSYVWILLMLLSILVTLNLIQVKEQSFSWTSHQVIIISLVSLEASEREVILLNLKII